MPAAETNETTSEFETTENPAPYSKYGQYQSNPSKQQLELYFKLNPTDLKLIATCRTNPTKLGMAIQLCTMRFLSTFRGRYSERKF